MSLSLLLRCRDLEETRRFYASILGFKAWDSAEGSLTVEMNGGAIIFTEMDLWKSGPACSGTLYFTVQDVDSYYLTVRDKASIAWPLQDMPYGTREFAVIDCNGYAIGFQRDT